MLWALDGYRALRDHEDETKANENAEDSGVRSVLLPYNRVRLAD